MTRGRGHFIRCRQSRAPHFSRLGRSTRSCVDATKLPRSRTASRSRASKGARCRLGAIDATTSSCIISSRMKVFTFGTYGALEMYHSGTATHAGKISSNPCFSLCFAAAAAARNPATHGNLDRRLASWFGHLRSTSYRRARPSTAHVSIRGNEPSEGQHVRWRSPPLSRQSTRRRSSTPHRGQSRAPQDGCIHDPGTILVSDIAKRLCIAACNKGIAACASTPIAHSDRPRECGHRA